MDATEHLTKVVSEHDLLALSRALLISNGCDVFPLDECPVLTPGPSVTAVDPANNCIIVAFPTTRYQALDLWIEILGDEGMAKAVRCTDPPKVRWLVHNWEANSEGKAACTTTELTEDDFSGIPH